jgi:hypothetical protein
MSEQNFQLSKREKELKDAVNSPESQEFLIQQEPYWKTPYFGQYGWVSTWANETDSWNELKPLLFEAYCLAAPKSLLKQVVNE